MRIVDVRAVVHTGLNCASTFAPSALSTQAFYCNSLRVFGAQAITKHGFKIWHNIAPCIMLHFA